MHHHITHIFRNIYLFQLCQAFTIGKWKSLRNRNSNRCCDLTANIPFKLYCKSSLLTLRASTHLDIIESVRASISENEVTLLENIDEIFEWTTTSNMTTIRHNLLQKIEESYRSDLDFCSDFASENDGRMSQTQKYIPHYEQIKMPSPTTSCHEQANYEDENSFLAIRTIGEPIFDESSIATIINAAESTWFRQNDSNQEEATDSSKSRFTYQRTGNYEAHTIELAKSVDEVIFTIMNDALCHRIYPMVRDAFNEVIPDINELEFCVYDSLIIRYNSTEAMSEYSDINRKMQFTGAGQPLHRDLGLVSVNIMLNSDHHFEGGGTFFEDQMRQKMNEKGLPGRINTIYPLKPSGVGQALAHLSSKRHAGAGTTSGVRDIMVIFLSAKRINESNDWIGAPLVEKAARLKSKAREYSKDCKTEQESILYRIVSQRLAIENAPNDGEAWHYFGMAIHDFIKTYNASSLDRDTARILLQLCISCLKHAMKLTPCDGRLSNNLGLCSETLQLYATDNLSDEGADFVIHNKETQEEILSYYERSKLLHDISKTFCDVFFDLDMTCLNQGLYLSKQDRFKDAANVLSCFDDENIIGVKGSNLEHMRIQYDGGRLFQFCRSRCR